MAVVKRKTRGERPTGAATGAVVVKRLRLTLKMKPAKRRMEGDSDDLEVYGREGSFDRGLIEEARHRVSAYIRDRCAYYPELHGAHTDIAIITPDFEKIYYCPHEKKLYTMVRKSGLAL
jgi:hypothetical protein